MDSFCRRFSVAVLYQFRLFRYGLILMLIFYLCCNRPWLGALLYTASYLPALWGDMADPLALKIGGRAIGFEIFALLAVSLIFLPTHTGVTINKWFFYAFYPRPSVDSLSGQAVGPIKCFGLFCPPKRKEI